MQMGLVGKLLVIALPDIDPIILLAPICLGLGACFIAAIWELEQFRLRRRRRNAVEAKLSAERQPSSHRRPPNHRP
jgi:hypothetical protein